MPTLLIIDDSPAFLASAGAMLSDEGFEVVGCLSDARLAVDEVRRLRPAVVLLDVQLPVMGGFEVARQLSELDPRPVVVLISSRDAPSFGSELVGAPVRGFIAKWELSGESLASMV